MGCGWDVAEIFILERFHLLPRNIIKWRFPKSCRYPKSSKSWMTIETYWNPWWPLWLGYSIQHFKKAPYAGISHLICGLGILLRHFETIFIHSMVFEWSSFFSQILCTSTNFSETTGSFQSTRGTPSSHRFFFSDFPWNHPGIGDPPWLNSDSLLVSCVVPGQNLHRSIPTSKTRRRRWGGDVFWISASKWRAKAATCWFNGI